MGTFRGKPNPLYAAYMINEDCRDLVSFFIQFTRNSFIEIFPISRAEYFTSKSKVGETNFYLFDHILQIFHDFRIDVLLSSVFNWNLDTLLFKSLQSYSNSPIYLSIYLSIYLFHINSKHRIIALHGFLSSLVLSNCCFFTTILSCLYMFTNNFFKIVKKIT